LHANRIKKALQDFIDNLSVFGPEITVGNVVIFRFFGLLK
jgi:hypothetical protein